ncbi:MAG: tetratricopeptide repeat protein [Bacteroidetes bacterium]|nr:tetratricopeptide repeat protein [Bacteroidota bacterium]
MRKLIFNIAALIVVYSAKSQNIQDAIKKTDSELFETAEADFKALINKEPNKGENYFYLGENYFKRDDADSANYFYGKGAELNATYPLNYVGLGKVLLSKNKTADAKTQFFKALSISQNKNAEVMRKIAEAWLATDNKSPDDAINQANAAIKLEPKNPEGYIILGDALLEKNPSSGGEPIKNYKMATTLNPKSTKGIIREGKLYQRGRNYQLALDKYKEAEAIDANYAPAYREKAELYYMAGQPGKSIENWKKYLELNNNQYSRFRYLNALFKGKQYTEVVKEYEEFKKTNFDNLYLERLAGYSYCEVGDKADKESYNKGLVAINKFFEKAGPNFKYIPEDYKYKGLLLSKTGKDSLGIVEIEKAIAADPNTATDLLSDIAGIYYKNKRYLKVAETIDRKEKINSTTLNNNDYFNLGRSYYYLTTPIFNEAMTSKDHKIKAAKELECQPLLIKADSAFSGLCRKNPNWSTAFIWRGRVSSLYEIVTKKEKEGLAKTHYEKAIATIKPEEKTSSHKKEYVEALEYLGAYYVVVADKAKADETWGALKELDPSNQKVINYYKPKAGGSSPKK